MEKTKKCDGHDPITLLYFLLSPRKAEMQQLLASTSVAAHELVNATSSVDELALTCVEWVR